MRFGRRRDDFEKDRNASAWGSAALPIPAVSEIGEAFDGHYAISTRVYGTPLESLDADGWRAVTPKLFEALDELRAVPVDGPDCFGATDLGIRATWREYLLTVDLPRSSRLSGWRERLRAHPGGERAFARGYAELERLSPGVDVAPHVVHGDLVNRNVYVDGTVISGIFDWGCSFTGDFAYEIALIVFWTSWYDALVEFDLLAAALEHWAAVGADLRDIERRLRLCAIHIGLSHIVYNAFLGNGPALDACAERMRLYL